jgi:hypothetical protein
LLIRKQKEGAGFQDWLIDLAKNGQTVYPICVNIGSLDIQADSGEINNLNVNNDAYAPDIDDYDEEVKEAYVSDRKGKEKQASLGDKEGVVKQASVACSLEFSDDEAYIDTIKVDSDDKFWSSFPRDRNSKNFILGGPQKPDTMGMMRQRRKPLLNNTQRQGSHSPTKNTWLLMKSMSNKGIAASPQRSQLRNFKGDPNKIV